MSGIGLSIHEHQPVTPRKREGSRNNKGHRKRFSASGLSTDSVSSLPEYRYSLASPPRQALTTSLDAIWDTDEEAQPPPDYSDPPTISGVIMPAGDSWSAEEADEELDRVVSPPRRRVRHRRSHSGPVARPSDSDPYLDHLLERSVKALEISNNLLLSSQNTQSPLANILAEDSDVDRSYDGQATYAPRRLDRPSAQGLSLRGLVDGPGVFFAEGGMSQSAPTGLGSPIHERLSPRVRRQRSSSNTSGLHLASQRARSPPPLSMTQYVSVESSAGYISETSTSASLHISSTMGLRSPSHTFILETPPPSSHGTMFAHPVLDERPFSPSTPAYHLLSSIVARSNSRPSSPSPATPSPKQIRTSSRPSTSTHANEAGPSLIPPIFQITPPPPSSFRHPTTSSRLRKSQSMTSIADPNGHMSKLAPLMSPAFFTRTPRRRPPPARMHTSPLKNSDPAAESGTSSSGLVAFRTMDSLRRILDDADAKDRAKALLEEAAMSEVAKGKRPAAGEKNVSMLRPRASTISAGHGNLFLIKGGPRALPSPAVGAYVVAASEPPSIFDPEPSMDANIGLLSSNMGASTSQEVSDPHSTPLDTTDSPSHRKKIGPRRRSALKISSGSGNRHRDGLGASSSSTLSSGQSTPRSVTFSPLPPKHRQRGTGDGPFKGGSPTKKRGDQKGWWTEWWSGFGFDVAPVDPYGGVNGRGIGRQEAGMDGGGVLDAWQV